MLPDSVEEVKERLHGLSGDAINDFAIELFEAGKFPESNLVFAYGVELRVPKCCFNLGTSFMDEGQWEEATHLLRLAGELGHRGAWLCLSRCLYELGLFEESDAVLQVGVEAGDPAAETALGEELYERGDREGGRVLVERACAAGFVEAEARLLEWRWEEEGDLSIEDDLWRLVRGEGLGRSVLAKVLLAQGRVPEARVVLEEGVAEGGTECCLPLGNLHCDYLGNIGLAKRYYRLGIERGDSHSWQNLGNLFYHEHRDRQAFLCFSAGAARRDDLARQWRDDLSRKRWRKNKFQRAIRKSRPGVLKY